jgi:hypothetical protein
MLGLKREERAARPNSSEQPDSLVLERRIAHLETALKLMDIDLQDAIDGFYRRRQSDRMREVREEDAVKKKRERPRDIDILTRALQLSGDGRDDAGSSQSKD